MNCKVQKAICLAKHKKNAPQMGFCNFYEIEFGAENE